MASPPNLTRRIRLVPKAGTAPRPDQAPTEVDAVPGALLEQLRAAAAAIAQAREAAESFELGPAPLAPLPRAGSKLHLVAVLPRPEARPTRDEPTRAVVTQAPRDEPTRAVVTQAPRAEPASLREDARVPSVAAPAALEPAPTHAHVPAGDSIMPVERFLDARDPSASEPARSGARRRWSLLTAIVVALAAFAAGVAVHAAMSGELGLGTTATTSPIERAGPRSAAGQRAPTTAAALLSQVAAQSTAGDPAAQDESAVLAELLAELEAPAPDATAATTTAATARPRVRHATFRARRHHRTAAPTPAEAAPQQASTPEDAPPSTAAAEVPAETPPSVLDPVATNEPPPSQLD